MKRLTRLLVVLVLGAPSLSAMFHPIAPAPETAPKRPEGKGRGRPPGGPAQPLATRRLAMAGAGILGAPAGKPAAAKPGAGKPATVKPAAGKPAAATPGVRLIGPPATKPAQPAPAKAAGGLSQAGRQTFLPCLPLARGGQPAAGTVVAFVPVHHRSEGVRPGDAPRLGLRRLPQARDFFPAAGEAQATAGGDEEPRLDLGALPTSQGAGRQSPVFKAAVSGVLEEVGGVLDEARYSSKVHLHNSTGQILCLVLPKASKNKEPRAWILAEYMSEPTELAPGLDDSFDLMPGETIQVRTAIGAGTAVYPITRADRSPYATLELAFE